MAADTPPTKGTTQKRWAARKPVPPKKTKKAAPASRIAASAQYPILTPASRSLSKEDRGLPEKASFSQGSTFSTLPPTNWPGGSELMKDERANCASEQFGLEAE